MMPIVTALPAAALLLASAICAAAIAAEPTSSPQAVAKGATDTEAAKRLKAERELEALLLQTLVATAFPKKDSRLFGTGTAGRQWEAMMTEHVARAMAASGQIRIFPSSRGRAGARRPITPRLTGRSPATQQSVPGWITVTTPETAVSTQTVPNNATW
jgi:hypothetical protein